MLVTVLKADPVATFADEVRAGLMRPGQKELPSKYFYDEVGSALFEVITLLPEYGLTRAEERLLQNHSGAIASRLPGPVMVAELGSGNGKKAAWILRALARRQPTTYYPIEISRSALIACERELDRLEGVSVLGFESEYLDGLRRVANRRSAGQRLLVLFLGSAIGNFDVVPAIEFLRKVREILLPGDALLLGADLVKHMDCMIPAYDDPAGVTAAFNLNLLARINRQLDGNFDLPTFRHVALWNEDARRIEMHLRSTIHQEVTIRRAELDVEFESGETIWTENSYKYTRQEIKHMAQQAGFHCDIQWTDGEWPFAQSLLLPA